MTWPQAFALDLVFGREIGTTWPAPLLEPVGERELGEAGA